MMALGCLFVGAWLRLNWLFGRASPSGFACFFLLGRVARMGCWGVCSTLSVSDELLVIGQNKGGERQGDNHTQDAEQASPY